MIRPILPIVILLCLNGLPAAGQGGHGFGPVAPVALPDVFATRHDGARVRLRDVLDGRRSAVQFIFVDCKTACPLLGSLFRKVDKALGDSGAQLVSITVNPQMDTPERLAEWRKSFAASARWQALRIDAADLPLVLRAFGEASGPPSGHTLQVFLVDERSRYVARTTELPSAAAVAAELRVRPVSQEAAEGGGRPAAVTGRDLFEGRGGLRASLGSDRLDPQAARCSSCHGANGEGGGEGKTVVPPLRGTAMTAARQRRGGPASQYSQTSFCESLRTGIDPAGVQFSSIMPRYQLDGRTCGVLWHFLTGNR